MKDKIIQFFSNLGRSLMMPIAALAACGIVLGLSSALMKPQVVSLLPFLQIASIKFIILALYKISAVVFTLIPVLFAISIALGLAKEDKEIAAFAGFIGYYTFLVGSSLVISTEVINFSAMKISTILGVETLDMGAIAGIIIGLLTAYLHNKFHKIAFPAAIAFYGGKRFVALIVILCSGILGLIMPFIWSPISVVINSIGSLIANAGAFGVFIYGMLERLLIPTGLHHVLNGLFRTTTLGGVYEGVEGCLNIFLQFIDKVNIAELAPFTKFLGQGKMPYMMFGLPAAAYAIYKTTPTEKKGKVKALMIAGVAASAISGITEPLEFSFMFIAPQLFLFHSVMGGLSFMLMSVLGVVIGNTGGGLIDFFIWGVFQPGSNWYWVIIVGIVYAAIYYFVFKTYLSKKNLSIDVNAEEPTNTNEEAGTNDKLFEIAKTIIDGLGGIDNIVNVNNCMSRLRVDVKEMNKIDDNILKATGSIGIVKPSSTHIQVIYGPKVESYADKVRELLKY
ncbi:MAG: PTS transporter subunit EIIC [Erysipelotrichaceae bacterium]|nr:PTS transporter subunit EIIC [Erysipelotrichaceae bacterium]MDY6034243.1 PTS transporter subunit EIIC [Bulleidia sp.]